MGKLVNFLGDEPILIIEAVKTLIALLVAFGLVLTGAQVAAIVAAVAAIITLIGAFVERDVVVPVNKVGRGKMGVK